MGSRYSKEELERGSLEVYEKALALEASCLFPDISIDESLLKYSGLDSNSVLQDYSNELVNKMPDFVINLGSSLAALDSFPNAVGLGAFMLAMIIEISINSKTDTQQTEDSYSMLRRVFGEEKASAVRDTMEEYMKRHKMFVSEKHRLQEELKRLEQQLSNHLTILKNSLLQDGQMSTRGLKIWVNGAFFHIQMLIHEARLKTGQQASDDVHSINAAITEYVQVLEQLLEKYKTYKISITKKFEDKIIAVRTAYIIVSYELVSYKLYNTELGCGCGGFPVCPDSVMIDGFVKQIFSKYEPILSLKNHFLNIRNNLNSLVKQHDSFFLQKTA